jgi:transposase
VLSDFASKLTTEEYLQLMAMRQQANTEGKLARSWNSYSYTHREWEALAKEFRQFSPPIASQKDIVAYFLPSREHLSIIDTSVGTAKILKEAERQTKKKEPKSMFAILLRETKGQKRKRGSSNRRKAKRRRKNESDDGDGDGDGDGTAHSDDESDNDGSSEDGGEGEE